MNYIETARQYRKFIEQASKSVDDATALQGVWMFPSWSQNTAYVINDRVQYNETLYKCVQAHTSQADWTPEQTPALWTKVSLDEYPEWVQPTGAQDAYNKDDKVSHNNKHWKSDVDSNVWEPGVYGWTEIIT